MESIKKMMGRRNMSSTIYRDAIMKGQGSEAYGDFSSRDSDKFADVPMKSFDTSDEGADISDPEGFDEGYEEYNAEPTGAGYQGGMMQEAAPRPDSVRGLDDFPAHDSGEGLEAPQPDTENNTWNFNAEKYPEGYTDAGTDSGLSPYDDAVEPSQIEGYAADGETSGELIASAAEEIADAVSPEFAESFQMIANQMIAAQSDAEVASDKGQAQGNVQDYRSLAAKYNKMLQQIPPEIVDSYLLDRLGRNTATDKELDKRWNTSSNSNKKPASKKEQGGIYEDGSNEDGPAPKKKGSEVDTKNKSPEPKKDEGGTAPEKKESAPKKEKLRDKVKRKLGFEKSASETFIPMAEMMRQRDIYCPFYKADLYPGDEGVPDDVPEDPAEGVPDEGIPDGGDVEGEPIEGEPTGDLEGEEPMADEPMGDEMDDDFLVTDEDDDADPALDEEMVPSGGDDMALGEGDELEGEDDVAPTEAPAPTEYATPDGFGPEDQPPAEDITKSIREQRMEKRIAKLQTPLSDMMESFQKKEAGAYAKYMTLPKPNSSEGEQHVLPKSKYRAANLYKESHTQGSTKKLTRVPDDEEGK